MSFARDVDFFNTPLERDAKPSPAWGDARGLPCLRVDGNLAGADHDERHAGGDRGTSRHHADDTSGALTVMVGVLLQLGEHTMLSRFSCVFALTTTTAPTSNATRPADASTMPPTIMPVLFRSFLGGGGSAYAPGG